MGKRGLMESCWYSRVASVRTFFSAEKSPRKFLFWAAKWTKYSVYGARDVTFSKPSRNMSRERCNNYNYITSLCLQYNIKNACNLYIYISTLAFM